jgi:hypothetical protein
VGQREALHCLHDAHDHILREREDTQERLCHSSKQVFALLYLVLLQTVCLYTHRPHKLFAFSQQPGTCSETPVIKPLWNTEVGHKGEEAHSGHNRNDRSVFAHGVHDDGVQVVLADAGVDGKEVQHHVHAAIQKVITRDVYA